MYSKSRVLQPLSGEMALNTSDIYYFDGMRWLSKIAVRVKTFFLQNEFFIDVKSSIPSVSLCMFISNRIGLKLFTIPFTVSLRFGSIRSFSRSDSELCWTLRIVFEYCRSSKRKKMTSGYPILQLQEEDVLKILAAQLHIGSKDVDYQMDTYVWKKKPRNEGSCVINIRKFWEKLVLAARAIVAVENPADVCVISCQPQGRPSFICCMNLEWSCRATSGSEIRQIHWSYSDW